MKATLTTTRLLTVIPEQSSSQRGGIMKRIMSWSVHGIGFWILIAAAIISIALAGCCRDCNMPEALRGKIEPGAVNVD